MTHLKKCYISRLCTSQPLPGAGGLCVSAVCECLTLHKSVWVACLFDCFLWPWRSTGRGTHFFFLLLKNIIWEWRTSRMYPTVCPDWNFLERGVWLRTLRRSTVFYYLCDQSDARSQVGELSFIFWRPWAWRRYKARLLEKLSYLFFCFLFFCMCLWAHPRRVFERKAANMLLFAHKYGAGMTLSRLWMYSCQDNSQATTAPELDLYTSAQNASVMVGRICPWLLLTSSYDLQRLDLVGVEPAAALCDV